MKNVLLNLGEKMRMSYMECLLRQLNLSGQYNRPIATAQTYSILGRAGLNRHVQSVVEIPELKTAIDIAAAAKRERTPFVDTQWAVVLDEMQFGLAICTCGENPEDQYEGQHSMSLELSTVAIEAATIKIVDRGDLEWFTAALRDGAMEDEGLSGPIKRWLDSKAQDYVEKCNAGHRLARLEDIRPDRKLALAGT